MEILHFEDLGDTVSFGCKHSCSSPQRVSNFNSNITQAVSTLIQNLKRDLSNIFRVRALTSSGSTSGRSGDVKTIISPNTLFGDMSGGISRLYTSPKYKFY